MRGLPELGSSGTSRFLDNWLPVMLSQRVSIAKTAQREQMQQAEKLYAGSAEGSRPSKVVLGGPEMVLEHDGRVLSLMW